MKLGSRCLTASLTLAAVLSLSAQAPPSDTSFGIDLTGMDRSVRPQDDFYRFVNGKWDDGTPIPSDMSSYGTFAILRDRAAGAVRGILDETSAGTPAWWSSRAMCRPVRVAYSDGL